jgi:hypothetical protein
VLRHRSERRCRVLAVPHLGDMPEQRHAGDQLDRVDVRAHHLHDRFAAAEVRAHGGGGFDESGAEHRIAKVVGGFVEPGEAVVDGIRRASQTRELREHVPDPVTALATGF